MMTFVLNKDRNLICMVKGAVGTKMFQNLWAQNGDQDDIDLTEGGKKSCAVFVTSILTLFERIDCPHATVARTIDYFSSSCNWQEVSIPMPGDIVEWNATEDCNAHIGFVISDTETVSNSSENRCPEIHKYTLKDGRKPIRYWRYSDKV